MMKKDPIVEEIRKIREEHAAKFNFHLENICADMKEKEEDCGHPVISLHPKRRLRPTGS
jgi:hypothetical protein